MAARGGRDADGRDRIAADRSAPASARPSLREQGIEATRRLREALGLPADVNDAALLGTAVARAAASEARRNPRFAREVRRHYDDLQAHRGTTGTSGARHARPLEPLVALRHTGAEVDPYAAPDPRALTYVYGADKLGRALQDYSIDKLRQAAAEVERTCPGTRPASRGRRDALIAYIVEHAGGR